ncbi:MAG: amino acid ABC transporter permease [Hyphomicrobiales bacterium]|nr:amino acid ABC transporter permease [Hyphomicrobiales bacterium]
MTGQAASSAASPRQRRRTLALRARLIDIASFVVFVAALGWLILRGAQSMGYNWQWFRVPRYLWRIIDGQVIWGPLMKGLLVTLQISAIAMALSIVIGLAVALLRLSPSLVGRGIARVYLEVIRNTPLLMQVLIFYFIIAHILGIPRFWAGVLCLAVYEGAFAAEIIRGGIVAVRRGQWEAARALGLRPFDVYRDVVLPQAVPLMLPPLAGVLVNLVKHSAIVSVIAVFDLTTEGRTIVADTFMAFEIWLTVAGLYLLITLTLSLLVLGLERRFGQSRHA